MAQKYSQDFLRKLELPQDDTALRWVAEQNSITVAKFARSGRFQKMQRTILQSLNDQTNIPWGEHYHDIVYNFWQDGSYSRGIWRRTHATSYLTAVPEWETVLDIDRLNAEEDDNWSYQGAELLYPDFTRALVFLSRGGDACEIREFDLIEKKFISDGFFLPESKSAVAWLDENHLLLSLDAGGDTLTTSGYPRCVSRWQRGSLPQDAVLIYAGETTDMTVYAWHDPTPGFEKTLVHCSRDFDHCRTYQITGQGNLESIDIPEDASCDFFNVWLLVRLTSAWQIAGKTYPPGALLAIDFAFFQQGQRTFTILFTPDEHTTLQGHSSTRDYLILNIVRDVVGSVEILKAENGMWRHVQRLTLPEFTTISASGIDTESNRYELVSHGFLQPCCLSDTVLMKISRLWPGIWCSAG